MNSIVRRLLLGILIWAVPFFVSVLIWNASTNSPVVGTEWFNAIMIVSWAVGFSFALYYNFKFSDSFVREGWFAGLTWFAELVIFDYLVLVNIFGMGWTDFYPLILTNLSTLIVSAGVGYTIKK